MCDTFPTALTPLEEYPSPIAVPRHRGPLPSCCYHSIRTEMPSCRRAKALELPRFVSWPKPVAAARPLWAPKRSSCQAGLLAASCQSPGLGPPCCPCSSPRPESLGSLLRWRPLRRFVAVRRRLLHAAARTALPRCSSNSSPKTFVGFAPWRDFPDVASSPKRSCSVNSDWFPTPTTVMLWPPKKPPRHRVEADTSAEALTSTSPLLLPTPRGEHHSEPVRLT